MLYILAFFLPPVAVLAAGKPGQATLNLILSLCFFIPGVIHALLVINDAKHTKQVKKQARKIQKSMR